MFQLKLEHQLLHLFLTSSFYPTLKPQADSAGLCEIEKCSECPWQRVSPLQLCRGDVEGLQLHHLCTAAVFPTWVQGAGR